MKKLYSCSAKCDSVTLQSYSTTIIYSYNDCVYFQYYPSRTSKYHIRKYIQWLHEHGYYKMERIVDCLYTFCRDNKVRYAKLDQNTGEIIAEN